MKILVIKFRNIGDVLLTSPLITALAQTFPDAGITAMVNPGMEDMLTGHPGLNEVMAPDPYRGGNESRLQFGLRVMRFFRDLRKRRFDLVINTTEGDRGMLFGYLSGAPQRYGYLKENDKAWRKKLLTRCWIWREEGTHTAVRNLVFVSGRDLQQGVSVELVFSERDQQTVEKALAAEGYRGGKPLVHVHPLSRWQFKCWDDKKMAAAVDYIQAELGAAVALTCGPDKKEHERLQRILGFCETRPLNINSQLSLKQVAALSAGSVLYFGVDTAPMHMAAAVNTPVVVLFGPTSAAQWGPWPNGWNRAENPYRDTGGVQQKGPHTLIQQSWDCVPCQRDGCDGSKRSRCLEELQPEQVLPYVKAAYDKALRDSDSRFSGAHNAPPNS